LNRLPPEAPSPVLADGISLLTAPVRTDDERLCRQVIDFVEGLLRKEAPDRVDAILRRLDDEYRAEQDKHGTVRLADPDTLPIADPSPVRN